ncbi:UNVERIFIED_CONTAM: hypothetical protein Sindi_2328100 [Sesamum indicum]
MLTHIRLMLKKVEYKITHIYREGNKAADYLANLACSTNSSKLLRGEEIQGQLCSAAAARLHFAATVRCSAAAFMVMQIAVSVLLLPQVFSCFFAAAAASAFLQLQLTSLLLLLCSCHSAACFNGAVVAVLPFGCCKHAPAAAANTLLLLLKWNFLFQKNIKQRDNFWLKITAAVAAFVFDEDSSQFREFLEIMAPPVFATVVLLIFIHSAAVTVLSLNPNSRGNYARIIDLTSGSFLNLSYHLAWLSINSAFLLQNHGTVTAAAFRCNDLAFTAAMPLVVVAAASNFRGHLCEDDPSHFRNPIWHQPFSAFGAAFPCLIRR